MLRVYLWHITYFPIFVLSSQSIKGYLCYGWIWLSISIFIVTILLYPEYHFSILTNLDIASIKNILKKYIHVYTIHSYILFVMWYIIYIIYLKCVYYLYVWNIYKCWKTHWKIIFHCQNWKQFSLHKWDCL